MVSTIVEFKYRDNDIYAHLVSKPHEDDNDFMETVAIVIQGYVMQKTDWIRGSVNADEALLGAADALRQGENNYIAF